MDTNNLYDTLISFYCGMACNSMNAVVESNSDESCTRQRNYFCCADDTTLHIRRMTYDQNDIEECVVQQVIVE